MRPARVGGCIYHDAVVDSQARGAIPLLPKDYVAAGAVLGRAFLDNPLWLVSRAMSMVLP